MPIKTKQNKSHLYAISLYWGLDYDLGVIRDKY